MLKRLAWPNPARPAPTETLACLHRRLASKGWPAGCGTASLRAACGTGLPGGLYVHCRQPMQPMQPRCASLCCAFNTTLRSYTCKDSLTSRRPPWVNSCRSRGSPAEGTCQGFKDTSLPGGGWQDEIARVIYAPLVQRLTPGCWVESSMPAPDGRAGEFSRTPLGQRAGGPGSTARVPTTTGKMGSMGRQHTVSHTASLMLQQDWQGTTRNCGRRRGFSAWCCISIQNGHGTGSPTPPSCGRRPPPPHLWRPPTQPCQPAATVVCRGCASHVISVPEGQNLH